MKQNDLLSRLFGDKQEPDCSTQVEVLNMDEIEQVAGGALSSDREGCDTLQDQPTLM